GPLIACSMALASTSAIAQAGATPPSAGTQEASQRTEGREHLTSAPIAASELCPTLEQAAGENGLPFDFFVRVIWQESRFDALAVSPKGAQGIAQFMPRTADWRGLSNPFDVSVALKASASYLRDLHSRFGNLGKHKRFASPGRRCGQAAGCPDKAECRAFPRSETPSRQRLRPLSRRLPCISQSVALLPSRRSGFLQ